MAQGQNTVAGPLEEWQAHLERHFSELAASRSGSGFPIFALEHGLGPAELEEIAGLLFARVAAGSRLYPHWLLWVVYATEQGYGYDGHEYWASFEESTPHWLSYSGGRQRLRSYFTKFQQAYGGVVPSGPWANWFSIIAWPITHAILPKYLQWQFAKALYEARHQFARMQAPAPADAGKLLASNASDASSRFREFLEQEELTGRIVLALLEHGTVHGQSPVYAPTLQRIVADLENVRRAGEWLKEARRVVADRIHGVGRLGIPSGGEPSDRTQAAPPLQLSVRPTLLLRKSGPASWVPVMDVPSFGGIARLSPELTRFIKSTRCKVAGAGDTWLPAGWLLGGSQRRVLKSWPEASAALISFERENRVLENILRGECRFAAGPVWLFRVASDGLAREIAGRIMRPGNRYVLTSRTPLQTNVSFSAPATIDCAGVYATALALPESLSIEEIQELHRLGLEVARNVRIWPAGFSVRNWDGEGHGEWLITETPCFGIVHDHPVDEYVLWINNGPETTIEGSGGGRPVFVRLSPLPPGLYVLSVKARRVGLRLSSQDLRDLEGSIEIKVRDPAPWIPGTTSHAGLAISLDPPDPSLDTFWEGNVGVSVLGPEGHSVTCAISLTGRNGAPVLSQEIGAFDLPITPPAWSNRFKRFANDDSRVWKYLEASTGLFVIKGDELGRYALRLEKDVKPVRWTARRGQRATNVRLFDDTGADAVPDVQFFPFQHAAEPKALDSSAALAGLVAEEPGGLFLAAHGDHTDALVVSSSQTASEFQALIVEPHLNGLDHGGTDVSHLLNLAELWHEARLAGPLADTRREHVARRLLACLYTSLCGPRWTKAETAFLRSPRNLPELERAVGGPPGFAVILRRDYEKMEAGAGPGGKWFAEVANRYHVHSDAALCEFALRLAGSPFGLSAAYGDRFGEFLNRSKQLTILLRGARLVALLAVVKSNGGRTTYLPRWAW